MPNLFRICLQRNCRYVNNYNPLLTLSLLGNVDIQGCTSKYGVLSYVTPYITHHGSKGGSPFAQAGNMLDLCISRTAEENKSSRLDISRFFNAQVAPTIISQLEVCHTNWNIPRHLYSRSFKVLAMKSPLRRVRTPAEVAESIRRGNTDVTNKTALHWYESRFAVSPADAPTGPHPWAPEGSWTVDSWEPWLHVCSFFERECVIRHENKRYAWRYPAAVVRVAPHLQLDAREAKNAGRYYSNIRMALLAYVAFPNAVWGTAYDLMNVVPNETAARTLEAFIAEEPRADLPPSAPPLVRLPGLP